jgi:hypothetical protein
MRSEAIEQLSVGKGAPTCRGFFSFSKDQDSISRLLPFQKMKKYFSMKHLQAEYTLQKLYGCFFCLYQ